MGREQRSTKQWKAPHTRIIHDEGGVRVTFFSSLSLVRCTLPNRERGLECDVCNKFVYCTSLLYILHILLFSFPFPPILLDVLALVSFCAIYMSLRNTACGWFREKKQEQQAALGLHMSKEKLLVATGNEKYRRF